MKRNLIYKLIIVTIAVFTIATGVAFNAAALLGNDPIGILYDGIRNAFSLSPDQLGLVSNYVNAAVFVIVLIFGRSYINLGTILYFLPYGTFVSLANRMYPYLFTSDTLGTRIMAATSGCLLIFVGVGVYIAMDIGLDPFSGLVLVIRDKLGWDYQRVKILFDITLIVISVFLGGTLGLVTIITALTAGPCIQFVTKMTTKLLERTPLAIVAEE